MGTSSTADAREHFSIETEAAHSPMNAKLRLLYISSAACR